MADNVVFQGTTPSYPPTDLVAASDKIGGFDFQRVKLTWGADGTATDASAAAPIPVTNVPTVAATATLTALASAATSAQLLASTAGRIGLILVNTDANAVLVKYGTTASATSFTVRIVANGYWEMPLPIYTGRIDAIWEADGAGSIYSTELT